MLDELIKAVNAVAGVATTIGKWQAGRKKEFAFTCGEIAQILKAYREAAADHREGLRLCGTLAVHAGKIDELADGMFASDEVKKLAARLKTVCAEMEKSRAATAGGGDAPHEIALDEVILAQGAFEGLAKRLNAV